MTARTRLCLRGPEQARRGWNQSIAQLCNNDRFPGALLCTGLNGDSPLGRGFLTGQITSPDDPAPDDARRNHPRFQGENVQRNLDLVARVQELAREKGRTPAQLALAWVPARARTSLPIPGTKRRRYLEENVGALPVALAADDLARIDAVAPRRVAAGEHYPAIPHRPCRR
jgi:aryl-alcohol dehydrogenase-like predicted oxidoreductase